MMYYIGLFNPMVREIKLILFNFICIIYKMLKGHKFYRSSIITYILCIFHINGFYTGRCLSLCIDERIYQGFQQGMSLPLL